MIIKVTILTLAAMTLVFAVIVLARGQATFGTYLAMIIAATCAATVLTTNGGGRRG
jgi:hypothetical protein